MTEREALRVLRDLLRRGVEHRHGSAPIYEDLHKSRSKKHAALEDDIEAFLLASGWQTHPYYAGELYSHPTKTPGEWHRLGAAYYLETKDE